MSYTVNFQELQVLNKKEQGEKTQVKCSSWGIWHETSVQDKAGWHGEGWDGIAAPQLKPGSNSLAHGAGRGKGFQQLLAFPTATIAQERSLTEAVIICKCTEIQ